jgi:hypothetical protein
MLQHLYASNRIRLFGTATLLFFFGGAQAQISGGRHVFQFMTLPPSARITGLGGLQIAVQDEDVAFAATNPAALNPAMDGRLSFNHNFFVSDIQHGYAAYAHHLPKIGFMMHGGIQYLNYGELKRADEFGNLLGTFSASETAFTLGASRPLNERFTLGLNTRFGFSRLDTRQSSVIAADLGLMYADTSSRIAVAAVLRNVGTQIAAYGEQSEDLPYDVQIGFSKRLRYLPFRFSVIAQRLNQWDIRYDDPNAEEEEFIQFGEETPKENKGNARIDNLFRHLSFGGEFLLGRNEVFRLRFGYNHLRKREMTVRNFRSLAGFSGGVGIKINRFRFDLGYASYHLGGGVLQVGIGTNLKDFFGN